MFTDVGLCHVPKISLTGVPRLPRERRLLWCREVYRGAEVTKAVVFVEMPEHALSKRLLLINSKRQSSGQQREEHEKA